MENKGEITEEKKEKLILKPEFPMFIKAGENEINNRNGPLPFQNIAQPFNTDFEVRQIIQRLSFMQDMLSKG